MHWTLKALTAEPLQRFFFGIRSYIHTKTRARCQVLRFDFGGISYSMQPQPPHISTILGLPT